MGSRSIAEIACLDTGIKDLILKRFKNDRKFNPDMDALCNSIESASSCDSGNKITIKVKKGERKKTERNVFMGQCMRKPEKGGMGKDMSYCSNVFKSMPESERKKYKEEVNKDETKK